jgi:hypothetical protein
MASFRQYKLVEPEDLEQRLLTVKDLDIQEHEAYRMLKDAQTGEHYLDYSYVHIDIAAGANKETFHHLMPLESDDVIAIMLGEQSYRYPDVWNRMYLRNGPDGKYVWFNAEELNTQDESAGREMQKALLEFKRTGKYDEEAIQQLFETMDRLAQKKDEDQA